MSAYFSLGAAGGSRKIQSQEPIKSTGEKLARKKNRRSPILSFSPCTIFKTRSCPHNLNSTLSFLVLCSETAWKRLLRGLRTGQLPVLWRKCRRTCQLFTFFSQCRSFSPCIGGHQHFSFSHRLYNIFMLFFQQKNVSLVFHLSLQISVGLFLGELRCPAAYFLFFSVFLLLN